MTFKHFLPAFIWASIIFIAISIPGSHFPDMGLKRIAHLDKIVHVGMFMVLGILLSYGFFCQKAGKFSNRNYARITILIGVFYGGITELLQYHLFSMRNGNFFDFLANVFGTIIGVLLFVLLGKLLTGKKFVNT